MKKDKKHNWIKDIGISIIIIIIVGAGFLYNTHRISERNMLHRIASQYNQFKVIYDEDSAKLDSLSKKFNNAQNIDAAISYAEDYARAVSVAKPHYESFLQFIDNNQQTLSKLGVDVVSTRRGVQDSITISNNNIELFKRTIEQYVAQQQAKQQETMNLLSLLASLML